MNQAVIPCWACRGDSELGADEDGKFVTRACRTCGGQRVVMVSFDPDKIKQFQPVGVKVE